MRFELCQRLNMMGIEPLGALEHTSSMVEKRIWRHPIEERLVKDVGAEQLQVRPL